MCGRVSPSSGPRADAKSEFGTVVASDATEGGGDSWARRMTSSIDGRWSIARFKPSSKEPERSTGVALDPARGVLVPRAGSDGVCPAVPIVGMRPPVVVAGAAVDSESESLEEVEEESGDVELMACGRGGLAGVGGTLDHPLFRGAK